MQRRPLSVRPIVVTAIALVLVIPILIIGGVLTRGYVLSAFHTEQQATAARALAFSALSFQLDEETGVRGYTATHQRLYLEPYDQARPRLPNTLADLRVALAALAPGQPDSAVADMQRINEEWLATVATPLITGNGGNASAVQRRGKQLVDRFRADVASIQRTVGDIKDASDLQTQGAVDRMNWIVLLAVVLIVGGGIGFATVQLRLGTRLAAKEREAANLAIAYRTEKRVADTLQEAFLQRPLPTLPSVSFSATYVPATEETKVGGDWYDGVELSVGRVMFVIGDVAGHGLDAAVSMNRTRQSLVSAAISNPDPGRLLERVNVDLLREHGRMVTAVCGYADSQSYEFVYATAGHPPPVLLEPGRPPRLLEFGGLPLGAMDASSYRTQVVQTVPGAMLVLYTDGAVEHTRDVIEGEQMLLDAVGRLTPADADSPAAAIHNAIFHDRGAGDDVAILTVAFARPGTAAGDSSAAGAIVATGSRGGVPSIAGTVTSEASPARALPVTSLLEVVARNGRRARRPERMRADGDAGGERGTGWRHAS